MFAKLGIVSIGAGFIAWLFGGISGLMGSNNIFVDMTLSTLSERIAESIVYAFSNETIQDALYILFFEIHLGGIFVGLGLILFIISLFAKEF